MRSVDNLPQVRRFLTWLRPGMNLKRWILLAMVGALMILDGFGRVLKHYNFNFHINDTINRIIPKALPGAFLDVVFILGGAALVYFGIRQWMRSIVAVISPKDQSRLIEVIYERRQLDRGYRLVAIGGGTGLSTVLRGLKQYSTNITAIVTVTDDGGSSGRLRTELGVLPPGDIRNCLVALADSESMMAELFQYRFHEGDGLVGHSFGNLFIAAMSGIAGDFDRAIKESSRVLAIKGRVLPSTLANISLEATLDDGSVVTGETSISRSIRPIRRLRLVPSVCAALPEAIEAILAADLVIVGPGSLYTSIMPNLLVPGIAEAIEKSNAQKIFVCNIMTQPGETSGMKASDHAAAIADATGRKLFRDVMVNVGQATRLLPVYARDGAFPVAADLDTLQALGYTPLTGDFVSEDHQVRHDANKLASALLKVLDERTERPALSMFLGSGQRRSTAK